MRMLTAPIERLHELLEYDRNTGVFTWKQRPRRGTFVFQFEGNPAGHVRAKDGYIAIPIGKGKIPAHRIAWAMTYGTWPTHQLDHINGNRQDNRIVNLREATNAQNGRNSPGHRDRKCKYKGVTPHVCGKFFARICVDYQTFYLGLFATAEDARDAYLTAAKNLHGNFSNYEP